METPGNQPQDFTQLKHALINRIKQAEIFSSTMPDQLAATTTAAELLEILKPNMSWCLADKLFTAEDLENWFGTVTLQKAHIYTSGRINIDLKESCSITLLASVYVTIHVTGSTVADIEAFETSWAIILVADNASANTRAWDKSHLTVKASALSCTSVETRDESSANVGTEERGFAKIVAWDSSSITLHTNDSSYAFVFAWNNSTLKVTAKDFSAIAIDPRNNSSATIETIDSASATVFASDSATATVKASGSSSATISEDADSNIAYSLGDGDCPTIKDLKRKKLIIAPAGFSIEEIR